MNDIIEGEAMFNVPGVPQPCKTWYKVVGDLQSSKQTPLILLHGGPAACHEYLADHSKLSEEHGIPVVLYDQLGNGKSTHLRDKRGDESFWSVGLFCDELDNLVEHLGIRSRGFDILGQSWGGIVALEYASRRRPHGLRRIILYSTAAAISDLNKDMAALVDGLAPEIRGTLKKDDFESEEYKEALGVFMANHMCRTTPFPAPELLPGFEHMEKDPTVYSTLWGPSELVVSGALRDWSVADRLHAITQPVLMVNGEFDQANVHCRQGILGREEGGGKGSEGGLPGKVRSVVIPDASHMAHLEQPDRYLPLVSRFLTDF